MSRSSLPPLNERLRNITFTSPNGGKVPTPSDISACFQSRFKTLKPPLNTDRFAKSRNALLPCFNFSETEISKILNSSEDQPLVFVDCNRIKSNFTPEKKAEMIRAGTLLPISRNPNHFGSILQNHMISSAMTIVPPKQDIVEQQDKYGN